MRNNLAPREPLAPMSEAERNEAMEAVKLWKPRLTYIRKNPRYTAQFIANFK